MGVTAVKTPIWTPEQREIVEADQASRIFVEAGPGTGKTAIACGRVAWLAEQGVNPSSILMFSFTRTAVAELRSRIIDWSGNPEVGAVRISTLDSQAWHFRYGTGSDFESLTNSFDENISAAIELLDSGDEVLDEYLAATHHLIIDESQDLTALRSRLVLKLIEKVPSTCGVTVFADPCQGIYGFTNDYADGSSGDGAFLDCFDLEATGFRRCSLSRIHRTDDKAVLRIFDVARECVANYCSSPSKVVDTIRESSAEFHGALNDSLDDTCLVLYRRRAQSLMDAHHYPHYCRLRMSGLPACIHPWIGAVLGKFEGTVIQLEEFMELWDEVVDVKTLLYEAIEPDVAWNLLHQHAAARPRGINLRRLRELLCRSRPHSDFLIPDFGMWGPTFGTIHGSKGREAENVLLMLPRNDRTLVIADEQPNAERRNCEESRVYYVGATRAKSLLETSTAKSLIGATSVDGGRVWHSYQRGKGKGAFANVQFGLQGDIDETAMFRRDFADSEQDALEGFDSLLQVHREYVNCESDTPPPIDLYLEPRPNESGVEYRYRMQLADDSEQVIGWLSPRVGRDLFHVGNEVQKRINSSNLRPPTKIEGYSDKHTDEYHPALRMLGLRTVVIPPEQAEEVHEPFRSSGFALAPILFGFPRIMFSWNNSRKRRK